MNYSSVFATFYMVSASDFVRFGNWDHCFTKLLLSFRSLNSRSLSVIDGLKLSAIFIVLFFSLFGTTTADIENGNYKMTNAEAINKIFDRTMRVQRSVSEYHHNHHLRRHRSKHRNTPAKPVTQCPPPPRRLSNDACLVEPCEADSECQIKDARCCYNGCIFTCAHTMNQPPVIDWRTITSMSSSKDFSSSEYDGNLEFDILPGEMLAENPRSATFGEICSTTVEVGDILLDCPHGYICHIEDKGNPNEGIPNRGKCVVITENLPENTHTLDEDYFY